MAKLLKQYACTSTKQLFLFFSGIFFIIIHPSTPARTPSYRPPEPAGSGRTITFTMNDVLGSSHQHSVPVAGDVDDARLPPVGLFPDPASSGGTAVSSPDRPVAATFSTLQGSDSAGWIQLFASSLDLEAGKVTTIDEDLTGNLELGAPTVTIGKAQGIYVTIAGDEDSGHMVAMKVAFGSNGGAGPGDSLRLFGVHRPGQPESHVAVVGGDGRYRDANGYAVLKTVLVKADDVVDGVNEEGHMHASALSVAIHLK